MRSSTSIIIRLLLVAAAAPQATTRAAAPHSHDLDSSYTFEQYVRDFEKGYQRGSDEWTRREQIFLANLETILAHNTLFYGAVKEKKVGHALGVNHLADLNPSELPLGYDKDRLPSWRAPSGEVPVSTSRRRIDERHKKDLPFDVDPVSSLPTHVDWREKGVVTTVKDQGGCGSCWAFASVAVLESHVALKTGTLFDLSPQELVSCVPNPHHCGGAGGCSGSTAEIAFDFVAEEGHGMVQEYQYGYTSYYGKDGNCTILNHVTIGNRALTAAVGALRGGTDGQGSDSRKIKGAVATIDGYAVVPTNDYAVLMNAIAKEGPIAVAVAASNWALYERGVAYWDLSQGGKSTDLNHAVVLVGYGTDEDTGEDYWLVRNSWRPTWGEGGYIRLKRVDPSTMDNPDDNCGVDTTPLDGMACETDENGNPPPKAVKVCGASGILYDGVIPIGGRRLM
uniref:Peptidase C1A papain C-terminal domain-containing protein n=1 Tax=Odontella aurita TaxID=265563 RepID=A0A7S4IXT0_9STRA|mmetsp:Transcript_32105/g.96196  ORF Transcript_32105/g.96196 Transcript_32105/m.96196 type:complete len:451 (+) Transcript_32105:1-1353(+)